jgi:glutathione S-transferase
MTIQLIGRSSSHFTRVVRIVMAELAIDYELVPVRDLVGHDPESYGGNPALKIPVLRAAGGETIYGTENICSTLGWTEPPHSVAGRNAHELVWHAMGAQVQLIIGIMIGKLPADNVYFAKMRRGFEGALRWLDDHLDDIPPNSLAAIGLYCLIDHMTFRKTVPLEPYPRLVAFAREYGQRPAALATAYRFD